MYASPYYVLGMDPVSENVMTYLDSNTDQGNLKFRVSKNINPVGGRWNLNRKQSIGMIRN